MSKGRLPNGEKARLLDAELLDLATLAEEMGYLALGMEHAAAYMNKHHKTAAAYLRLYRQRRKALWLKTKPPKDYQKKTIMTTWGIAFATLDAEAAALLNLCIFLAPDGIPLTLLSDHADTMPPPLDKCAADELRLDAAIDNLRGHALLTRQGEMLAVHRLVGAVARERMGAGGAGEQGSEGAGAKEWVDVALKLLSKAWPFDKNDMTTWAACGQLLPHVMVVVELAAALDVESTEASRLNNAAGFYLQHYGDLEGALPFWKQALDIRKKVLGDDHQNEAALQSTATSLNNMGFLLQAMGDYEGARPFYQQALDIRKKVLGDDHPDTAGSYNNLAVLSAYEGDMQTAIPLMRQALMIWEKALGYNHPQTQAGRQSIANMEAAL